MKTYLKRLLTALESIATSLDQINIAQKNSVLVNYRKAKVKELEKMYGIELLPWYNGYIVDYTDPGLTIDENNMWVGVKESIDICNDFFTDYTRQYRLKFDDLGHIFITNGSIFKNDDD